MYIIYIYIIHMISLNRCPLSFDLPFVVFEGTLIKSYKSIMIWIWNVIICFPILHWAFLLLRPLRVESEVRCRGMDFFLRPQRGQPPGICVTSKWSCFFPLPTRINHFRRSFWLRGHLWTEKSTIVASGTDVCGNSLRWWTSLESDIWWNIEVGRRKLPTSFAWLPSQDVQQTTHLLQMMAVFYYHQRSSTQFKVLYSKYR